MTRPGNRVRVEGCEAAGIVTRVVSSMFGQLAILDDNAEAAYALHSLRPVL